MELHPSHLRVESPRLERVYVHCGRPDCGADDIIDGDKPCPVPVRSAFMDWAVGLEGVQK